MNRRSMHLQALFLGVALSFGLISVTLAPRPAFAQADLGSISGVVTDSSGAVVPNAKVTVTNTATAAAHKATTNGKGEYIVAQLIPADYRVSIDAPGFTSAMELVTVTVGSQNAINVRLSVSGGKTEVVVMADNFAAVQLEKAEISTVIDSNQIQNLPTLDRDPYNLVALSGSITFDPTAEVRGVGFNIAGSRSSSVDILLDGAENTDLFGVGVAQSIPMDATQEFRLVTSNSGAEYGRGSGAVNVSSKSGSNELHGSLYEFNRISTLASDGYNNNAIHAMYPDVTSKPRFTHNQFGYSVGGPFLKNKLFFFSSTEWTRIVGVQNSIAVVPTTALLNMSNSNTQAFFTKYGALSVPINGATYKGSSSQVQSLYGSDVASIAISQLGLPESTTITPDESGNYCADAQIASAAVCTSDLFGESIYQYAGDSGGGTPVNQWISFNRVDWTINETTSLFGRYIQESATNPEGTNSYSPYAGYSTGVSQNNESGLLSLNKLFRSNLASATKLEAARYNQLQPLGGQPASPTLFPNYEGNPTLGGGLITYPGYFPTSPAVAIPFGGPQNIVQIGEDIAWSKGRHQINIGGSFLYLQDNRAFGAYENAVDALKYSSSHAGELENFVNGGMEYLSVAINPNGAYPCVRDASTGIYTQTAACTIEEPVSAPNFSRSNRFEDEAFYVNDSYKTLPHLTLNFGLRWEIYGPQHSQRPEYDANFFPGAGENFFDQIANGQVLTAASRPGHRMWKTNYKQFAPKVGFAWDPFGNGKTAIRGGFGISYERNYGNVTFNVIQNPPNYAVLAFTPTDLGGSLIPISTNNFSTFGTSSGSTLLPNVTLRAVDPNIKPAYAPNWNLTVERQFGNSMASLSYVGSRGIHNYTISNINRPFSGSNYLGYQYVPGRNNLQYSSINWRAANGDSYYHGLTGSLRGTNLWHTGMTVRADYTWSHSIDNNSSSLGDSLNGNQGSMVLGYTDPFNHALDRGSSDFDVRSRISAAVIWEIPYAKRLHGTAKLLFDNWTASTTFVAQTGTPFSVFDCGWGVTPTCMRASFVNAQPRKRTGGLKDISSSYGPNTFAYMTMPTYADPNGPDAANLYYGVILSNYNEQLNPAVNQYYDALYSAPSGYPLGGSDVPICTGLNGVGCHFVSGMSGRNSFSGPGLWNENLALIKNFKIDHDRYEFQLKAEFINVFNHANTFLNLGYGADVSSQPEILAYKGASTWSGAASSIPGNRNTELSLHVAF